MLPQENFGVNALNFNMDYLSTGTSVSGPPSPPRLTHGYIQKGYFKLIHCMQSLVSQCLRYKVFTSLIIRFTTIIQRTGLKLQV